MELTTELKEQALEWFQKLLRIDTSNPPGNERLAYEFIKAELARYGVEVTEISLDPERPNLVAYVGEEESPTLILSSHLDVVPVENPSRWKLPPFSGEIYDDMVWGRGAVDVKYKTAFDMAAMVALQRMNQKKRVVMLAVADEEVGGDLGSSFVGKTAPFAHSRAAVFNEVGGFTIRIGALPCALFQVGEKSHAHIRIQAAGLSSHASMPLPGTAVSLITRIINAFETEFLGYAVCPSARIFFEKLAAGHAELVTALESHPDKENDEIAANRLLAQGAVDRFKKFLSVATVEDALEGVPDPVLRAQLRAMVCHTVCPTRIGGGFKLNVIPDTAWVDFDCRVIPGTSDDDFLKIIQAFVDRVLGDAAVRINIELVSFQLGYELPPGTPLLERLLSWATLAYDQYVVLPMLLPASSDNSTFFQAGLTPLGFAPLFFPDDFPGFALAHADNERMPVNAFNLGLEIYFRGIEAMLVENG